MRTASYMMLGLLLAGFFAAPANAVGQTSKSAIRFVIVGDEADGTHREDISLEDAELTYVPAPKELPPALELQQWTSAPSQDENAVELPVLTARYSTEEEAREQVYRAAQVALTSILRQESGGELPLRVRLQIEGSVPPPPPEAILILKSDQEGETFYQAALRIKAPYVLNRKWIADIREARQAGAMRKTIFVFGGLLGLVAIFALQTRLNYALNGKYPGILRAIAMVAILCLLGGMTAAATAARVFTY